MKVKPLIYIRDGKWRVSKKPPQILRKKSVMKRWAAAKKHVRRLNEKA